MCAHEQGYFTIAILANCKTIQSAKKGYTQYKAYIYIILVGLVGSLPYDLTGYALFLYRYIPDSKGEETTATHTLTNCIKGGALFCHMTI